MRVMLFLALATVTVLGLIAVAAHTGEAAEIGLSLSTLCLAGGVVVVQHRKLVASLSLGDIRKYLEWKSGHDLDQRMLLVNKTITLLLIELTSIHLLSCPRITDGVVNT